jgi:hypothetical protein
LPAVHANARNHVCDHVLQLTTRILKELSKLFDQLVDEDDNDVIKTYTGDYFIRFGLTARPQTTLEIIKQYPIMHAWICVLCRFENLIYRVNAKARKMGRGKHIGSEAKQRLKDEKFKLSIGTQQGPMHLKLNFPDSTGAGGSSDTAGLARRLFEAENCQHFLDLVDSSVSKKAAFAIILRIVSSRDCLVDVDALIQLCIDTFFRVGGSFSNGFGPMVCSSGFGTFGRTDSKQWRLWRLWRALRPCTSM